jgi:hypothetical protein
VLNFQHQALPCQGSVAPLDATRLCVSRSFYAKSLGQLLGGGARIGRYRALAAVAL